MHPLHIQDVSLVILEELFDLSVPVGDIFLVLRFHLFCLLLFLAQLLLELVR